MFIVKICCGFIPLARIVRCDFIGLLSPLPFPLDVRFSFRFCSLILVSFQGVSIPFSINASNHIGFSPLPVPLEVKPTIKPLPKQCRLYGKKKKSKNNRQKDFQGVDSCFVWMEEIPAAKNSHIYSRTLDIQIPKLRFGIWTPKNIPKTPNLRRCLDV